MHPHSYLLLLLLETRYYWKNKPESKEKERISPQRGKESE